MAIGTNAADFAEQAKGVDVRGAMDSGFDGILTPQALGFVASLHRAFNSTRLELLGARDIRQAEFDAGAQGEHKLVRGFEPVLTHSWHNVDHSGFRDAVAEFCEEEARDVQNYHHAALDALPYRQPPE